MGYLLKNSCSSILDFLQSANLGFTTAAPDGATVTQMGIALLRKSLHTLRSNQETKKRSI